MFPSLPPFRLRFSIPAYFTKVSTKEVNCAFLETVYVIVIGDVKVTVLPLIEAISFSSFKGRFAQTEPSQ